MKYIITLFGIFALLLFTSEVNAQDATVRQGATNFKIALDAGDTILNTNTLRKTIGVGAKQSVQLYTIQVTIDSISGTPAHTITTAGSIDNSNWTTIDTVSWGGTTSDTTFVITDISTGIAWPYVSVLVTGSSSSKSQLTYLGGRFIDEVR